MAVPREPPLSLWLIYAYEFSGNLPDAGANKRRFLTFAARRTATSIYARLHSGAWYTGSTAEFLSFGGAHLKLVQITALLFGILAGPRPPQTSAYGERGRI